MHVVLVEPEIPPNTGNIARLCAATRTPLHLVEPLGFRLDDTTLKRAGMDYWRQVKWRRWPHWRAFWETQIAPPAPKSPPSAGRRRPRVWFIESGGPRRYSEAVFGPDDYLVFGRETAGLPSALLAGQRDHWLRLPMFNPASRSLNLANCVAIVLYEALRQNGFPGECPA
jgi:tRNA (cytidine/uridine-2'-O-)-methyltransferase